MAAEGLAMSSAVEVVERSIPAVAVTDQTVTVELGTGLVASAASSLVKGKTVKGKTAKGLVVVQALAVKKARATILPGILD